FYDHIITFSSEIELIWGRRFTSVTLIFHLNRWLIFLWAVIGLSSFHSLGALHVTFSAVRMYAISGGNRWLAVTIFALCSAQSGVDVVSPSCYKHCVRLCVLSGAYAHEIAVMVISRTCVVVADMLVLLVTWSKTYSIKRDAIRANTRALLATMLLRDGECHICNLTVGRSSFYCLLRNCILCVSSIPR
ncbi:hypothetical protein OBBRIDRAFT_733874, partial [Obba rivulosa]